ncbi:hypothetical protein bcere0007_31230 [Bacillus mycoides]|nr:hypothetical protein bcere0007_31230 [Bacillus mycoides]
MFSVLLEQGLKGMFNWTTPGEVIAGILLLRAIAIATRYTISQIQ